MNSDVLGYFRPCEKHESYIGNVQIIKPCMYCIHDELKQLRTENEELKNAEKLLNNIVEAYCLINPNPEFGNMDDYDRLFAEIKKACDLAYEK